MILIELLGPISAVNLNSSGRIAIRGEPVQKLLLWLASNPETLTERSVVADALWPDATTDRANASLRTALRKLRVQLDEVEAAGVLRVDGRLVGMFELQTDLQRFRAARDANDLESAYALVRGTPLADLSTAGGDWTALKKAQLIEEVDDVMSSLANQAARGGDHRRAAELHEARLRIDGANEHAVRGLMLAHERSGNRALAVGVGEMYRQVLPTIEPQTLELAHRISIGRVQAIPSGEGTPQYAPSAVYAGSSGFDPEFNTDLTRDLRSSRCYMFRGVSAKYVAPRVIHGGDTLEIVRVLALDPRFDHAVRVRAQDRSSNPKYAGYSVDELSEMLIEEILRSMVALFDLRKRVSIDVGLIATTSVDRIEVFDDNCYISLYHGASSVGRAFPETARYGATAVAYGQHRMDCVRQLDVTSTRWQFRATQTDADLIAALSELRPGIDQETVGQYRDEAERFAAGFMHELAANERSE